MDYNKEVINEIREMHKRESIAGVTILDEIKFNKKDYEIEIKIKKKGVVSVGTIF